jgi:predicted ATPase/DNA-binding CsgD family transcriptional regulator
MESDTNGRGGGESAGDVQGSVSEAGPTPAATVNPLRPLTTFVGRERELSELRLLLREGKRLLTLTGIGGIGKTRLALEVISDIPELGVEKAHFVDLASVTNPQLIDNAVLEAIGGGSHRAPLQATLNHLRDERALVVLDSCEHVLQAVGHLTETLLSSCPFVVILATSRSPLDIPGEMVWTVPALSMRDRDGGIGAGLSDAGRLFADRASHVRTFELDHDVVDVVETIVRRVDGIPLAIELAAARVRVLSPQEIVTGLDDHLRLLRGARRVDPRHQTIRASLDWSHELLTDEERRLFARLSIFSGSFDLAATAEVCVGDPSAANEILDQIQGLVEKSLVTVESGAGGTRYGMLGFVRQYAYECLMAEGDEAQIAGRHRTYFRQLAECADRELWALNALGRARLDEESPNLRTAIADGCARAPSDALAIVGALWLYWRVRGRVAEGVAAVEQSLAVSPLEPSSEKALALAGLAILTFWLGDYLRTQSSVMEALEIGAAVGDNRSQSFALGRLGALVMLGDPNAGGEMLDKATALARQAEDVVALCDGLCTIAVNSHFKDDRIAMHRAVEELLRLAEPVGFDDDVRWCLWALAHAALSEGDLSAARAFGERGLAMMPGQDKFGHYCMVEVMALLDAMTGAPDVSRLRVEVQLESSRQERMRLGTAAMMHALGVAALAADDLDGARQWATTLYSEEPEVCYLAWHAQEILTIIALDQGDYAQAKIHVEIHLATARRQQNLRAEGLAKLALARTLILQGEDTRAESISHQALKTLFGHGWRPAVIEALEVLAEVALFQGQHERAVRLLGACTSARSALGLVPFPTTQRRADRSLLTARAAMGDQASEVALADGAQLSLDNAVAYAQRGRGERADATRGWASLSPVERQVVDLASKGLDNPAIGEALFISRHTVKAHLSHSYSKLGVANRTELAQLATAHSLTIVDEEQEYPPG